MHMNILSDFGKLDRQRLTALLNYGHHTITVIEAAMVLEMQARPVAKLLSRWVEKGWISRVKRGLYALLSTQVVMDVALDNSWIIAEKLYHPCYIGAQSAAAYWRLLKQKPHSLAVLTTQKPRNLSPVISNTHYSLRTVSKQTMFGLHPINCGGATVVVSDPARTIIDFLVDPKLGGGIYAVIDLFINYLKSEYKNIILLFDYAKRIGSGAVLKRLGFLLEQYEPYEYNIIAFCKMLVTTGYIKLDPQLDAKKLVTRWGLWIPGCFDSKRGTINQ